MRTIEYLKRYAYYYLYTIVLVLVLSVGLSHTTTQVSSSQAQLVTPVIIIDAGHGGIDGGTSGASGITESEINLNIALRLDDLMGLLGCERVMTRETSESISTEGNTIREQKRSDLNNRVSLVNSYPESILVSIHQNFYPQSKYSGSQVFYAATEGSQPLAERMQTRLNDTLHKGSERSCKKSDGVFLMEHIQTTGILIECGFLSNPTEEMLLQQPEYQKKLCCVIASILAQQVNGLT